MAYICGSNNNCFKCLLQEKKISNAQLSGSMPEPETGSNSWFKRRKKGISTSTAEKKEAPDGLWTKCPDCKYTCTTVELKENFLGMSTMPIPSPHW